MFNNMSIKELSLKALQALLGVVLLAFGASASDALKMGLDPFTAMNTGISDLLGWSLGTYQLLVNFIIIALVFFLKKELIGIGTVINMVLVGFLIDWFNPMIAHYISGDEAIWIRLIGLVLALLVFNLGIAIYLEAKIGTAPYDAVAPIIEDRTGFSFKLSRIIQDMIVVAVAFFFGGPIGITTFVAAFFNGPMIEWLSKKVGSPMRKKIEAMTKEEA